MEDFAKYIRSIPDFPKPGINFKDITTLVQNGPVFAQVVKELAAPFKDMGIEQVLGAEARGFIFGAPVALELGAGFIPVRKPGKLPGETISVSYELEYGTDAIEIHSDAIKPGQKILIVDDLLATGGTAAAMVKLVEQVGGNILGISFLIELSFINGRAALGEYPITSLISYDAE